MPLPPRRHDATRACHNSGEHQRTQQATELKHIIGKYLSAVKYFGVVVGCQPSRPAPLLTPRRESKRRQLNESSAVLVSDDK